jgi:hypothetical protein
MGGVEYGQWFLFLLCSNLIKEDIPRRNIDTKENISEVILEKVFSKGDKF